MVTCTLGPDQTDREPGPPHRHHPAAALCLRLPGGLPGRRVRRSRLAPDPPLRRLGVAAGLAGRVLLHADRRSVRAVPLHGRPRAARSCSSPTCRSSIRSRSRSLPTRRSAWPRAWRGQPAVAGPRLALLAGVLMMLLDVVIDPAAPCGAIAGFSAASSTTPTAARTSACRCRNFAGWVIVGAVGVGGYLCLQSRAHLERRAWRRGRAILRRACCSIWR